MFLFISSASFMKTSTVTTRPNTKRNTTAPGSPPKETAAKISPRKRLPTGTQNRNT